MGEHEPEKLKQILTWIGVVNQLNTTRFNQRLADENLPLPQFSMLNHFSRDPERGHTITQLASAFQANQPAITKTVQHLLKKDFLVAQVSKKDRRVKYHFITKLGLEAHRRAIAQIMPDAQLIFSDWTPEELNSLHQALFRLKNWLDDNRDTVADGSST